MGWRCAPIVSLIDTTLPSNQSPSRRTETREPTVGILSLHDWRRKSWQQSSGPVRCHIYQYYRNTVYTGYIQAGAVKGRVKQYGGERCVLCIIRIVLYCCIIRIVLYEGGAILHSYFLHLTLLRLTSYCTRQRRRRRRGIGDSRGSRIMQEDSPRPPTADELTTTGCLSNAGCCESRPATRHRQSS